jgi:hypothetical protein
VAETGIYWSGWISPAAAGALSGVRMIERSVLSPTVNVPNGAQLTVTYSISLDFTAIDT